MCRLVLLSVLALTVVGCGGDSELSGVKQAISDTATVPTADVSCSERSEHHYECTTPGMVWSVGVKPVDDGWLYSIDGSR